jgi:hypothetical protein
LPKRTTSYWSWKSQNSTLWKRDNLIPRPEHIHIVH